jgi:Tol biopolymer transport system component
MLFPDGRSLVTAVGIRQSAVWVHDPRNERVVSIEGYAFLPLGPRVHPQVFSPDGSKLFYLVRRGSGRITLSNEFSGEVWMSDVETSRSGPVLPGLAVIDYDVSPDGQRILFAALDEKGRSHIHLGWLDRRTPPRQVSPVEADSPRFDPKNDRNLYCRMIEGASNYLHRMRTDGAQLEKAVSNPVTNFFGVSPDGAWLLGHVPAVGANTTPILALPTAAGQSPRIVCTNCESAAWAPGGKYFVVTFGASGPLGGRTFVISLPAGEALPNVPPDGIRSQADLSWLPSVALVRDGYLSPGRDPSVYAYTRPTIQRNLHRVSLP